MPLRPARPFKILLVGAGQFGSRHLQGLARARLNLSIEILEPQASARETAIQRFHEIPACQGVKALQGIDDLESSSFDGHADLAIIATTAATRCEAIQGVLNRLTIPFLVLEKVLFQRIADVDKIEKVLSEHSCTAWVNCSRRLLLYSQQLREIFLGDPVQMHAQGENWGLGCNGIHLLDLLAFLSGSSQPDGWNIEALDRSRYASKRENYVEFGGAVGFRLQGGHEIVMRDGRSGSAPLVIEIAGPHARATVNESASSMTLSRRADGWNTEQRAIHVPRQSELTNLIAEDILIRGTCGLTEYRESATLHRAYLGAFLEHLGTVTGVRHDVCPIT